MDHHDPVARAVHVQLPPVGASGSGGKEPRQGILAMPAGHAAVCDELRQRQSSGSWHRGRAGVEEVHGRARDSDLNIAGPQASAYQTDMPELTRVGDDAAVDQALIARWTAGDERAATALVERHATSVTRFVVSLGGVAMPEEIVQDTFVRAFGSLDAFRGESSLRSWLFTIARRLVLDQRRLIRRERLHVSVEDAQSQLVSGDDLLDSVVADESEARVRQAVEKLSPMQREVFTLRVVEGLSYKDIAAVAATTEGSARVHYHNAMKAVKEFLDA
jgi:RNA polymerase sigma-70 factor, ECF subfamily